MGIFTWKIRDAASPAAALHHQVCVPGRTVLFQTALNRPAPSEPGPDRKSLFGLALQLLGLCGHVGDVFLHHHGDGGHGDDFHGDDLHAGHGDGDGGGDPLVRFLVFPPLFSPPWSCYMPPVDQSAVIQTH